MIEILVVVIIGFVLSLGLTIYENYFKKRKDPPIEVAPTPVNINLDGIRKEVNGIPGKVLQSIQSSTNNYKGSLGELVGYMQLSAKYDRIVPLNNIVDFMCIKFPDDKGPGSVDFVDVKTGNSSRLSKDQRELQKLIKDKRIHFIKLKVNTNIISCDEIKPKKN